MPRIVAEPTKKIAKMVKTYQIVLDSPLKGQYNKLRKANDDERNT